MFTGIVQALCPVVAVSDAEGIRHITVDLGDRADGLQLGASVANNGTCLTVSAIDGPQVRFDVIAETAARTNLGSLQAGDRVNIERSLAFGDELGGHLVSGHVSGTATVDDIIADQDNRTMWFAVDGELMPFLFWKGWVAIDGASLTVSGVDRERNRISVSLIPETLARTTLGHVEVGASVNVEVDAQTQTIVETVRSLLADPDFRSQILQDT